MSILLRSLFVATLVFTVAVTGASAQDNNPNHSGGAAGSLIAVPEYPAGVSDPALSPGVLSKEATGVPAADNPNVAGATGLTIVHGDRSTINGDRQGTIDQRTGTATASDAPG